MTEKYDVLAQQLAQDDVQKKCPALKLVNPFIHPTLKARWNTEFKGRLEALNEKPKLGSKRLVVFYDYWHLGGLEGDQAERETPWDHIVQKLRAATRIDQWLWHNFVCFIKIADRATAKVSTPAPQYCLPYFLGLVEAQETELMVVTNYDVLNLLMRHYELPEFSTLRDAVFSPHPVVLPNRFKTKVISLYHPGQNGQMACLNAHRYLGRDVRFAMDALLIEVWRKRLSSI